MQLPNATLPSDKKYNQVFEKLVGDADAHDERLIGLIAYGLYKVSKRQWICSLKNRMGDAPILTMKKLPRLVRRLLF